MRAYFFPNPGFSTELLKEPDAIKGLKDAGEGIKRIADPMVRSAGGPWMPNKDGKETIEVVEVDGDVYVSNTDHGGHLIEWGSVNNPPHAPLRRAAMAAGTRLDESSF